MERMYHIVTINEKRNRKVHVTRSPLTHKEACTMLTKFTPHPELRRMLEEVTQPVAQ